MTERLRKQKIVDLQNEINGNEYYETRDIIVKVSKSSWSIHRKLEKGTIPIIENLSIQQCYNFLQGYKECKLFYTTEIVQ